MDRFLSLLRELLRTTTVSRHCSHIVIRILRRSLYGTRGDLEIRYLLDDLLESLYTLPPSQVHEDIRKVAEVLVSIRIPLKSSKRTNEEAPEVDRLPKQKRPKRALEDAQLLYNYINPLPSSTPSTSQSIGSLLSAPTTSPTTTSPADLYSLYICIEPLIPDRGTMTARKAKLAELCNIPDPDTSATITALDEYAELASKLCAPVRDAQARELHDSIAKCKEYASLSKPMGMLESAVADAFKQTAKLIEDMQRDMKQFQLGVTAVANSEGELQQIVKTEAMKREKEAIASILEKPVLETTQAWLERILPEEPGCTQSYIRQALVNILFRPDPVCLPEESSSSNTLPPIFYLAAKHLWLLQNRIQAVTILATISTLVPVQSSTALDWSARVWTILLSEVDTDGVAEDHVKLANLEDEIIRAVEYGRAHKLDRATERSLRENVRRMVRLEDPVFKLLSGRLKAALLASRPLEPIKGFQVEPLHTEIEAIQRHLQSILGWACESWDIPQEANEPVQ